jgi:uncharacterized surface protein with fasciclin (FAS1) repeats
MTPRFGRFARAFLFLVLALVVLAPAAPAKEAKMKDITDTVFTRKILSRFAQLLQAADLASFTSSRGPLTAFVPTNSAFTRFPPEELAALLRPENKEVLQRIVLFHLVNGQRLTEKDLAPLKTLVSCEGTPLPLRVNRAGYQIVSRGKILEADIRCLNGLIHEIDYLLLPPGVSLSKLAGLPPVALPASESKPEDDSATNAPPSATATTNASSAITNAPPAEPGSPTNSPAAAPAPPAH